MASADTLCRKLLNVKNTVVESHNFYNNVDGVTHLRIKARPNVRHQDDCPFCERRNLLKYGRQTKNNKVWRGLDFAGILVEIEAPPTASPVQSTALSLLLFHGHTFRATLPRTSI